MLNRTPSQQKCEGCRLAQMLETAIELNRQLYEQRCRAKIKQLLKIDRFNLN
jgi:hypothetical protein